MSNDQKPCLKEEFIDPRALDILDRLQSNGFTTYLVGGCIRDLMVGITPKDFDIVTNARPQQIKKTVPNSYIIGRRFRLVLAKRNQDQFEISTFRRDPTKEELENEDTPFGDNLFGTPKQDAFRRDFTINSLFYDPLHNEMIDHCNGKQDLENRIIRMIGNAYERFIEDPIRIFRALRLAYKLNFTLDGELREMIPKTVEHLPFTALPRRREEVLKILRLQNHENAFHEAYDLNIFEYSFPTLHKLYEDDEKANEFDQLFQQKEGLIQEFSEPVELFSLLVWAVYRSTYNRDPFKKLEPGSILKNSNLSEFLKFELGMFNIEQTLVCQALELIPEISNHEKLQRKSDKKAFSLIRHPSFELAYKLCKMDCALSPEGLYYWNEKFQLAPQKPKKSKPIKRKSKKRKNHRTKRK